MIHALLLLAYVLIRETKLLYLLLSSINHTYGYLNIDSTYIVFLNRLSMKVRSLRLKKSREMWRKR